MKFQAFLLMFVASLLFWSCSSVPSQQEISKANFGTFPADYEAKVKGYYDQTLKDPYSAKIEIAKPAKGFWTPPLRGTRYGWISIAKVNAKNSYGGYTGTTEDWWLINDEGMQQIIRHMGESGFIDAAQFVGTDGKSK